MGERWAGHPDGDGGVINLDRYFCGNYPTEVDALADPDGVVEPSGLFRVFKEVPGHYMASRPGRDAKDARIDRLLVPGQRLRDAGWTITIGIEAKRSGEKVGPAVAQAIDYTWCVFRVGTTFIYPEWIFLWPLTTQFHAIASVMAQNKIGEASKAGADRAAFHCNGMKLLEVGRDGGVTCSPDLAARIGHKKGSR